MRIADVLCMGKLISIRRQQERQMNQELEKLDGLLQQVHSYQELSPGQKRKSLQEGSLEDAIHRVLFQLNELKKRCLRS